ncbi:putative phage abortive infection protein, partial [uncultured Flavobacterium sp.]|uniref:putative phage abortive infection protein n=1 Tax=uncultured Flavobacterium sp. TaxID=165435 RepID=UPI0025E81FD9
FIDKSEKESIVNNSKASNQTSFEYQSFADFIQAQMSIPELFLLFYNSLSFPKFKDLLIQFNALENLPYEHLLDESHNNVNGIKLKSKNQLLGR